MNSDRLDPRPASADTMSSISVSGKDYVLLAFKRDGDDWYEATTTELPAPQNELKKVVKKKEGNALPQLERMGNTRRKQIQEVAAELTTQEAGDIFWEPVVIQNTDERKNRDGKLAVKAFKVIFARRMRKPDPAPAPPPKVSQKPKVKQAAPAKPKEEKPKEPEKPKPIKRNSELNDPFSSTQLFSPMGQPMDERGPIIYQNAGLPTHIGTERPIGYIPPPPPPQEKAKNKQSKVDPLLQQPLFAGLENLDDILGGGPILSDEIDGIINVGEPPKQKEHRSERHRNDSKYRRRSSAIRDSRNSFHANPRFSDTYSSSRSSWASDESAILGEWDDLSSRTSEDTHDSLPRSPIRRTHKSYYPQKKYYHDPRLQRGDRVLIEDSRRQRYPAIEERRNSIGIEEPYHRRSSPILHQQLRPNSRQSIPPEAVYPSHYEEKGGRAEDYMREREREAAGSRSSGRKYDWDPREQRRDQRSYY